MCNSCLPRIPSDVDKMEAFAGQMISMLNQSALGNMVSIGHRTSLFDVLDTLEAATSTQIAKSAGLNERYVREWLGAMVSGKIVDYDPENNTYMLPAENALFLTRKSNEKNMAAIASILPIWSSVEDKIVGCFEKGGGVPYSEYGRFYEVMGEISNANVGVNLIDNILTKKPELMYQLKNGISVLDIGCGDGKILMELAKAFPNSQFTGIDLCKAPVESAKSHSAALKLNNIEFLEGDVLQHDFKSKFDFITTFDVIHDLAFPAKVLTKIFQLLKGDGQYLMMDIKASSQLENNKEHPFAPFLYTASTLHCMSVSLAQGGMGLGTVWGVEKANEMLTEAGFSKVEMESYEHDMLNSYYFCSK
ncbi:class I SAM-dependent methyltransferase [Flagellimonas nanhaiensis]|uniref:Class I SAM-dependent methyltransferase n=1 Tax=Flagellimonas nanhaiensis TaxID=2292706 RepID=A0A371JN39_9FLAO|nr:class I SAM-dependent methyltransferase [Allomuricauda nanhaiensis]RDY58647.1 class I SAM-dependent methyltransferase [Allomuricauda nanhaiensis]